jgi:hypothetical protein
MTMKSTVDFATMNNAGDLPPGGNSPAHQVPGVSGNTSILPPARAAWLLGLLTLIGAALRLHSLAARSLWIDEAASVSFASLAW